MRRKQPRTEEPTAPFKYQQRVSCKTKAGMTIEGRVTFIGYIPFPGIWSFEVTTDDGQVYKTHGAQSPDARIVRLEEIEQAEIIIEKTPAGDQTVIPGAERREIPDQKLKPRRAQAESLTALEGHEVEQQARKIILTGGHYGVSNFCCDWNDDRSARRNRHRNFNQGAFMNVTFIKPQLAKDASKQGVEMGNSNYAAEPKLDGFRGQLHLRRRKPAAMFTRNGNNVLGAYGLKWIHELDWKVDEAILDCELYSGNGTNLEASVASALARGRVKLGLFDLLSLEGTSFVKNRSWSYRRKILDRTFEGFNVLPYTMNHDLLWREWVVKHKGEGIVLKHTDGLYLPGKRAWLRIKNEETYDVVIAGVSDKPSNGAKYKTGEVGLTFGFWDAQQKRAIPTGQGLKVGSRAELTNYIGRVAEILCNGITEDGSFRHARFIRWRDPADKRPGQCTRPEN